MATAVRTLKTMRPHIPLIKFPARNKAPEVSPVTSAKPATSANPAATGSKAIGATLQGSGIDDIDLPQKYKRKLINVEEMEYIERGGPP